MKTEETKTSFPKQSNIELELSRMRHPRTPRKILTIAYVHEKRGNIYNKILDILCSMYNIC